MENIFSFKGRKNLSRLLIECCCKMRSKHRFFYNDFSVFLTLFKTPTTPFLPFKYLVENIWRCYVITIGLYEFFCTMLKNRKICKVGHPLTVCMVWYCVFVSGSALQNLQNCLGMSSSRFSDFKNTITTSWLFQALFLASYFIDLLGGQRG